MTENAVFHAAFFTDFACGAGGKFGAAGMCGRFPIWLIADLADGAFCARSFAARMCGQFPVWLIADFADGAFCARSRAARVRNIQTRIHFASITPINKLMIAWIRFQFDKCHISPAKIAARTRCQRRGRAYKQQGAQQQNAQNRFFHVTPSLSSNLVILSDQTARTAMQALHLSPSAPRQAYRFPPQKR